MNVTKAHSL